MALRVKLAPTRFGVTLAPLRAWSTIAARWFVQARWLHVGLIVLLGALLRFWGVLHGWREDFVYHPDAETITIPDAWGRYVRDEWVGRVGKASTPLFIFLHAGAIRIVAGITEFLAMPINWTMPFVAAIGSTLNATLGTITVLVVYTTGLLALGHAAGVVAALLLAVSPLHSLHSHYPYPDVTMTFFLALALLVSVTVLSRPSIPRSLLGVGLVGAAAATKVGGFAVAPAVGLALFLGWRRRLGTLWAVGVVGLLALLGAFSLQGLTSGFYRNPWQVVDYVRGLIAWRWGADGLWERLEIITGTLSSWYGVGEVLLAVAGVVVAGWRRMALGGVLLVLLGALSLVLYLVPVPDDRFLVPVTVGFALLGGLGIAEGLKASRRRALPLAMIALILGGTLLPALHRSVRQGLFLMLPDTRYLAGLWLEAHVPLSMRVAIEGYWPLGANERPGATYFDVRRPLSAQADRFDLLVTSSLEHGRYVERPNYYPRIAAFFRDLPREARLVRSFELFPMGFTQPTIRVWWPNPTAVPPMARGYFPRPFEETWNGGVSWLDEAPYDKDDRTWWIRGGYHRAITLVSQQSFETLAVFLRNGTAPSRVRIRTGLTERSRWLSPHGRTLLTFTPGSLTWQPPYLAPLRISVDSGDGVLVQVRHGARAIGETFWSWGEWDQAIPWLRQATRPGPPDPEALLLLASAYVQSGRAAAARETLDALMRVAPEFLSQYRALVSTEETRPFDQRFAEFTGLNPALLRFSLATTFEAEALPRLAGEVEPMRGASGDHAVIVHPGQRPSLRVITYGPYTYFPWGAYRAVFRVHGLAPGSPGPVLEVQAGQTLLARMQVAAARLPHDRFIEVAVPFSHPDPAAPVEFRVLAAETAGLAIDAVRVEPDLQAMFAMKLALLRGGSHPPEPHPN